MDLGNGILTDDHVAEMLAKEANDSSLKYSSMGLEAYRNSRPVAKAKPNTRFLRHIINETKNHNEALLAKEAAESQARLDSLAETKAREERKRRPGAQDLRRRQLGSIAVTLGGKKRKHDDSNDSEASPRKRDPAGLDAHREYAARRDWASRKANRADWDDCDMEKQSDLDRGRDRGRGRERDRDRERHRREEYRPSSAEAGKAQKKRSKRPGDKFPSPSPSEQERHHRHKRRHDRRDRSPGNYEKGTGSRSSPRGRGSSQSSKARRREGDGPRDSCRKQRLDIQRGEEQDRRENSTGNSDQDSSDPLEDFIGPKPSSETHVRARGRGAASGPSAMDSRFSDTYDPKSDLRLDTEMADDDDWDQALEALRDRQKWRQQGADRLRAAGFTAEQIKKWEASDGREKGVEDVRWAKPGEGREWDRGKATEGLDAMLKARKH